MLKGIDVSSNNQHPINWEVVRAQGVSFVFVKLTELSKAGGYVNPYKDEDIAGAKAAGLDVAGYTFIHPDIPAIDTVNFVKQHSAGVYRIAIDSEINSPNWTHTSSITHQCLELLNPRSMLYCNLDFLHHMQGAPWNYKLWLAQYGPHPEVPNLIWQSSQTGRVKGVVGDVDLNSTNLSQSALHSYFSHP